MSVICGNCKREREGWGPQTVGQLRHEPDLSARDRWCEPCEFEWKLRRVKFPKEPKRQRTGFENFAAGLDYDRFGRK